MLEYAVHRSNWLQHYSGKAIRTSRVVTLRRTTTMNRAGTPSGRATVASKTTFEALTVDSGEESPDEEVEQPIISDRSECCNPLAVVALL